MIYVYALGRSVKLRSLVVSQSHNEDRAERRGERWNKVDKLRIGIVGCGWVARNIHIPVWTRLPNVTIAGVLDLNQEVSREVASQLNAKSYPSLEAMLDSGAIDIIDICTPTFSHYEICLKALRAGKHVLTEKPIALTSRDAEEMIEEARRRDRRLGVVQHYLYSRGFQRVCQMENEIGKPLHVEINFWAGKHIAPSHWSLKEEVGGGMLFEQGIHACYILVGLIGLPEEVTATGGRLDTHDFLNTCDIFVQFTKGSTTGSIHLLPTESYGHTCVVIGEHGEIFWDLTNDAVVKLKNITLSDPILSAGLNFSYNRVRLGISAGWASLCKGLRYSFLRSREYDQFRLFKAFVNHIKNPDAPFLSSGELGCLAVKLLEKIKADL